MSTTISLEQALRLRTPDDSLYGVDVTADERLVVEGEVVLLAEGLHHRLRLWQIMARHSRKEAARQNANRIKISFVN